MKSKISFLCRSEILLNIDPYTTAHAIRVGKMKLIHGTKEAGKYGTWIRPDEHITEEDELLNGAAPLYEDSGLQTISKESKIETILASLGRPKIVPHPAIVKCGAKPANASTNCDIFFNSCLYDISRDPCEYNNLASVMPNTVKMLETRLEAYKQGMIEPRNKVPDPLGDPSRFEGVWTPWVDELSSTDY